MIFIPTWASLTDLINKPGGTFSNAQLPTQPSSSFQAANSAKAGRHSRQKPGCGKSQHLRRAMALGLLYLDTLPTWL